MAGIPGASSHDLVTRSRFSRQKDQKARFKPESNFILEPKNKVTILNDFRVFEKPLHFCLWNIGTRLTQAALDPKGVGVAKLMISARLSGFGEVESCPMEAMDKGEAPFIPAERLPGGEMFGLIWVYWPSGGFPLVLRFAVERICWA